MDRCNLTPPPRLLKQRPALTLLVISGLLSCGCSPGLSDRGSRTGSSTSMAAVEAGTTRPAAADALRTAYGCCVDIIAEGLLALSADRAPPAAGMAVCFSRQLDPVEAEGLLATAGDLCLPELEYLSPETARVLGGSRGILRLQGLQTLSPAAAAELAGPRDELTLGNLRQLSAATAAGLAGVFGTLKIDGLQRLDPAAAAALAGHRGSLCLNGLEELSAEAAEALACHRGDLCLNGVQTLSVAAAAALAAHQHGLHLNGLRTIPVPVADLLSRHRGWAVSLNGLDAEELAPEAYALLCRNRRVALSIVSPPQPPGF